MEKVENYYADYDKKENLSFDSKVVHGALGCDPISGAVSFPIFHLQPSDTEISGFPRDMIIPDFRIPRDRNLNEQWPSSKKALKHLLSLRARQPACPYLII